LRTLVHLSDLHFGRVNRALLEPLRRRLAELAPDLVVVSGDLTQRARARQFREARAFLDSLPKPQLLVPGNHDVPLYNLFARFLRPLGGYRRIISREVEPGFVDDEIAVLGINTAHAFTWKGGRVSEAQIERMRTQLSGFGSKTRIVVSHHPFAAIGALAQCGVDVFVSGHCHKTSVHENLALMVAAGTATSRRTREEPNGFNLLRIGRGRIDVEHHVLRAGSFVRSASDTFARHGERWSRVGSL
jgi:3',5'-cyclic AMP phosphodiesterase CpdA